MLTSSLDAKRDDRIRTSGNISAFDFMGVQFPTVPITLFYDWLYISALHQNRKLSDQILQYSGFTDIAFNPQKSWNCQARSAALYLALHTSGKLQQVISDTACYLSIVTDMGKPGTGGVQMGFGVG